ncbi:hypothetical protein KBZ21_40575, partial [Streptomyces sp. A73]|nr:hypothetical protein [Streptomyces sp. A73]
SRSPHWYDDGGLLQPGLNLVANGTGRPEPVLTGRQWDVLTGAGDASAVCVERPPVVEGQEYLALTYLGPPTTGSSVWVELR